MRVLILAAGVGSRLRPLTDHTPKPLLPLGTTNILKRLLSQLNSSFSNIEIYVNCSYLAESIVEFVSIQALETRPKIIWEYEPLGTAVTTLRLFKSDSSQGLMVIHGDLVVSNDSMQEISTAIKVQTESFLMVHERPLNKARSIVSTQDARVTGISEVSISQDGCSLDDSPVLVNSGILFFAPDSLTSFDIPENGTEISPYLIQKLSDAGKLVMQLWKWKRVAVDSISSYENAIALAVADPSV
jgi:NDP-sugar pyrophosphorylase family protein